MCQGRFFSGLVQQLVAKQCCAELQTVPVSVSAFAICLLFSPRVYPSKVLTSSTNSVCQKDIGFGFGMKLGVAVSWEVWEMLEVAFRAEWIHPGMKYMRSAQSVFQSIEIFFSSLSVLVNGSKFQVLFSHYCNFYIAEKDIKVFE